MKLDNPDYDYGAWEEHIQEVGRQMAFPPTPDVARSLRGKLTRPQRLVPVRSVLGMAVILGVLLLVPDVRATALEFLQIGAVEIETVSPTSDAAHRLDSILDLPGETSLQDAQPHLHFSILALLAEPDRVFMPGDDLIILVWEEPELMSLFIIQSDFIVKKYDIESAQMLTVNGKAAAWLEQVHILEFPPDQEESLEVVVEGNVLIWQDSDDITYRLEGSFSLDAALRIAESGTD